MTIKFLQTASEICFGTAIAFAILAAALFFLLDIRENFLIETDCARRKTIDEMHERNRRTGKLREEDEEKANFDCFSLDFVRVIRFEWMITNKHDIKEVADVPPIDCFRVHLTSHNLGC